MDKEPSEATLRHSCRGESSKDHNLVRAQPPHICLGELLPAPPTAVTWEITTDILDSAVEGHALSDYAVELPAVLVNTAHGRIWGALEPYSTDAEVSGLFPLY